MTTKEEDLQHILDSLDKLNGKTQSDIWGDMIAKMLTPKFVDTFFKQSPILEKLKTRQTAVYSGGKELRYPFRYGSQSKESED